MPSYQNQTQADIESGRSRMNSVESIGSFGSGSGHSDDALLPEVRIKKGGVTKNAAPAIQTYGSSQSDGAGPSGISSPRRANRENISLLRGRHRSNSYEEIGEAPEIDNDFTGKDNGARVIFYIGEGDITTNISPVE